jgi:hypothetical protein
MIRAEKKLMLSILKVTAYISREFGDDRAKLDSFQKHPKEFQKIPIIPLD